MWSRRLEINRNPLPQAWLDNPKNWALALTAKFQNNFDLTYIFSKAISDKLSGGSIGDLYIFCRTNFADDHVQTQTPQLMNLGFLTIKELDEVSGLSTPTTIIWRPMYGSHWSAPNHVFVKLKWLEWVRQSRTTNITIKLVFKLGKKIRNLSAKTFRWVDQLCTQLLLVQTR